MAPFYGWGSTASRLEPLRGDSLLFTTKFPEHQITKHQIIISSQSIKSQEKENDEKHIRKLIKKKPKIKSTYRLYT